MIPGFLGYGAVSAVVGAILYANLPTSITIGAAAPTVDYLLNAKLIKIDDEKDVLAGKQIRGKDLFEKGPTLIMAIRRPGCQFCRHEAKKISELKDQLNAAGVQLVGVVHETHGVNEFKPYLNGDVYYDVDRKFYGPKERWMPVWLGFLRLSTYMNAYRTSGTKGNFEGEGRLLGGVFLINKDKMVYSHLEKDWGDAADVNDILTAVKKL
uniref:Thioredoxin domain-containing protein n=1 Tax=Panagrolaimus sp. ES5 TaxID=591445 RepID=A0AC34FWF5_9BILA